MKARFNQVLDDQKRQVQLIEETIAMTKNGYSESLKELERISEEIHQRRAARQQRCEIEKLGIRQDGVGAENPPPAISLESGNYGSENCKQTADFYYFFLLTYLFFVQVQLQRMK